MYEFTGFTAGAAVFGCGFPGWGTGCLAIPVNSAISTAGVAGVAASALLRRTNWMVPWLSASASFSDCSGVTNSVTTLTFSGLPFGSGSILVPVDNTWTFCRTVRDVVLALLLSLRMVTSTSTREPGKMNP